MQNGCGAVVVALYGTAPHELKRRLSAFGRAGLKVVAVNNNATAACPLDVEGHLSWLENGNIGGLAGGLNRGVTQALALGCGYVTLLDQDSELSAAGVLTLQEAVATQPDRIVGPSVWDQERDQWHTRQRRPRLLITSGTTFQAAAWQQVGGYHEWMEIDFIDHEWCSRARRDGFELEVLADVRLNQQFGQRHPSPIAHSLGLQLYSPYRRAVALRNLRWLLRQAYVPLDIRLKEAMKMLLKPWCWLALEPQRRRTARSLLAGLRAPLEQPFPRALLKPAQQ